MSFVPGIAIFMTYNDYILSTIWNRWKLYINEVSISGLVPMLKLILNNSTVTTVPGPNVPIFDYGITEVTLII